MTQSAPQTLKATGLLRESLGLKPPELRAFWGDSQPQKKHLFVGDQNGGLVAIIYPDLKASGEMTCH